MWNIDSNILKNFVNNTYGINNTKFLVLVKKVSYEKLAEQYIDQLIRHGAKLYFLQEAIWYRNKSVIEDWMNKINKERTHASV